MNIKEGIQPESGLVASPTHTEKRTSVEEASLPLGVSSSLVDRVGERDLGCAVPGCKVLAGAGVDPSQDLLLDCSIIFTLSQLSS